ncbi:hypothetical protein [Acinetobacter brisouii]|uniref:hypothetical protein n=1 Tax=Acinetobacter brisouii TaxID=396323 RepID=UPI00124D1FB2|nr:hypothetical protein [Acinetobacter brisouii]
MLKIFEIIAKWFKPVTVEMIMADFKLKAKQLEKIAQHHAQQEAKHAQVMIEAMKKQDEAQTARLHAADTIRKINDVINSTTTILSVSDLKKEINQ